MSAQLALPALDELGRYARFGPTNPGPDARKSWMVPTSYPDPIDPWTGVLVGEDNCGCCSGCGIGWDDDEDGRTLFCQQWRTPEHEPHLIVAYECGCELCALCFAEERFCGCGHAWAHDDGCPAVETPEPRCHKRTGKVLEEYEPEVTDLGKCTCELSPAERRARWHSHRLGWRRDPVPGARPWGGDDRPLRRHPRPDVLRHGRCAGRASREEVAVKRAPVQADNHASLYQGHPARVQEEKRLGRELRPAGTITWEEHLEAWRGCNARFPGQSAERIAFLGREPHTWEAR